MDQPRQFFRHGRRIHAKAFLRFRPDIGHQDVAARRDAGQHRLGAGMLQVQADRPLAAVEIEKLPGHARRAALAAELAQQVALRAFQLDDLRPLFRQYPGANRADDDGGQVQHAQPVERSAHGSIPSGSGGVPWVWKEEIVCKPQAWPRRRSASVQMIGFQSGARTSRAPALASSTRLPPGS